jgi:hypothetical protein
VVFDTFTCRFDSSPAEIKGIKLFLKFVFIRKSLMGVGKHTIFCKKGSNCLFWQSCLKTGNPSLASWLSVETLHPNFSNFKALGHALKLKTSTTQSL